MWRAGLDTWKISHFSGARKSQETQQEHIYTNSRFMSLNGDARTTSPDEASLQMLIGLWLIAHVKDN